MNRPTPKVAALACVVLTLMANLLLAQESPTIHLTDTRMRAPLDVVEGKTKIQLCDLTPGEQYMVIANGAVYGQKSIFELSPASKNVLPLLPQSERANIVRFTALASCVDLQLVAVSMQPLTTIPLYLSIKCQSCPEDNSWLKKFSDQVEAANLTVAGGVPAESLITNTLIGGDCFEVSNVTSSGHSISRGTFSSGSTNIGLESGMVLCTGSVGVLPGPNFNPGADGGFGNDTPDDPDLAALAIGDQFDLSTIEFDFTPTANMVQFDFVFGSEEYCEYVGSEFNDVFGFFISGPGITGNQNIALITGSNTPVASNNVNYLTNSTFYINNTFFPPCTFLPQAAAGECELDGWTSVFTAVADVIPCSTYHIKLAIADLADSEFASAVFLRANSFNAGGSAVAEAVYSNGLPNAFEACDTSYIRFVRDNADNSEPLEVTFNIDSSSTATAGVDYVPLSSPIVIPAGQDEVLVPVLIHSDTLTEGLESIILLLDNACSCDQTDLSFLINDKQTLEVNLEDQTVCTGQEAMLMPEVSGLAPFTYLWSTGDTTAAITVMPLDPTSYGVTVTDACGEVASDSAQINILPAVEELELILFCPGDSVLIEGMVYTDSITIIDTLPGLGGDCDTIRTFILELLPLPILTDTIVFCAGDTLGINDMIYTMSGTVIDTLPGMVGACDTIINYELIMLPRPTRTEMVALCPRDSIEIGGIFYGSEGTVLDTIPGLNGDCDTAVSYIIEILPQPVRTEMLALCPGESVAIGGAPYSAPGTVLDTIPGLGGSCDTVVTYELELLAYPMRAETILFCPGETVEIAGTGYTTPGIVLDTVTAAIGCDTIITYTLAYQTPAPSNVSIDCPADFGLTVEGGDPAIVNYDPPVATSDCPCPGIELKLVSGPVSGSVFPAGITTVCYVAQDSCGNTASCCFDVTVTETNPCDIKTIGCMVYELLSITRDAGDNKTYRIRVTNNCNQPMMYVAFELPDGQVALKPANNSLYTSPGARKYAVRNPNYSPFYSIRFSSKANGLANGESDIFEFKLPAQSTPPYIQVVAKVATQSYYEAYLNTFFCPIGVEQIVDQGGADRENTTLSKERAALSVYPNPTTGLLFLDLSTWSKEQTRVRVLDSRGQLIMDQQVDAGSDLYQLQLPKGLAGGLYFLDVQLLNGDRQILRFVVQR